MKLCTSLVAALCILAADAMTARAAVRYWDINGTADGAANGGIGDGAWSGTAQNWNTDPTGGAAGEITAWTTPTDDAVFSAGNDVSTDPLVGGAFISIEGTQTVNSILIEDGYVKFVSGTANHGTGTVEVLSGATLDLSNTERLNLVGGRVKLSGGHLHGSNPGPAPGAGSLLGSSLGQKVLEINGTGIISFSNDDGTNDNAVAIFTGVIEGTGGTTTNGGAGTLIKRGVDQIGIGASDQDPDPVGVIHSHTLFTFAKLRVEEGAYRLRNGVDATVKETAFGAVPLAELPDAITLDGGGIGTNSTVTLHAFRGVTIGPNGGYLDHGATAGLNIPGPLTASPGSTLTIGSPTSTALNNVTFSLSHANNVNTFQGNVHVRRGVLLLSSSLNAANFSGTGMDAVNVGTVNVAAGQTFTFGSGGATTTYDGILAGAGTFRKVGNGTTTFTGTNTNTHSGNTVVEGGTLSITSAYLANGGDVYLTTGAALNLNFAATDDIDQLFIDGVGQTAGIWGAIGSGAANTTALLTGTGLLNVLNGPSAGVFGDFNDDGVVDAADYVIWRKNDGPNGALPNDNGVATQAERYGLWVANFGTAPGGGSDVGVIPEPTSVCLLVLGLAVMAFNRRSR